MDLSKVGLLVHTQYMQFKRQTQHLKNALFLSVNVFNTKVQIRDTIFSGTAILCAHPSQAKVYQFTGQREYLHFLSYFKTLSTGPSPGIEHATLHSAVERSTH